MMPMMGNSGLTAEGNFMVSAGGHLVMATPELTASVIDSSEDINLITSLMAIILILLKF
jgi:hypothetical protein